MGIRETLAKYSESHRKQFNDNLFVRSEYDIIEDIKKIIMSVASPTNINENAEQVFIGVNYFRVIDDYREVSKIVYDLESDANRRNKRIEYNIHDYINLKDSDIILLEVNYHLEVNGSPMNASVYIDIPKVINKYYFRISGTIYSTLYQIADASTYNNSQSKKKVRCVSFRQEFQKHVVYEKKSKINQVVYNDDGSLDFITVQCINYTTDLFGNNIPLCKYFLANYGLVGAMNYLNLAEIYLTTDKPYHPNEQFVTFVKDNVYISVPFMVWDNSPVTQSFIYAVLMNSPKKCTDIEKIYPKDYWLMMLGSDFKNKSVDKGLAMLDSVSKNYSLIMKEGLKLPDDEKRTLLDVLRWEMYEFDALWNKDNYDMTYKKLRISSYIAGFYAAKLTRNLISATNSRNSLTVEKLYKALCIPHEFILDSLKRSNLVSYKNGVNDDDTFSVLKYTFKGVSGIGENKASAVPVKYRLANVSHIGKVDCDTSPAGDPGMTGLICPYVDLNDGMYLGDYQEPCNWREEQDKVIDEYRKIYSISSIFKTKEEVLGTAEGKEFIDSILNKVNNLLPYTVGNDPEIK
jgi:hypothetical protein